MTVTTKEPRKRTRFMFCDRHAPMFLSESVYRRAETMVEGGWASGGPCSGGVCRLFPGRDFYVEEICHSEYALDWTGHPSYFPLRLEEIRRAIHAENISYGEIAELQSLAAHIDPSDVELLEWAGVPEYPDA